MIINKQKHKKMYLCAHFCSESNTMYNNTEIPEIISTLPGTLPFVYESDNDPLSGINF